MGRLARRRARRDLERRMRELDRLDRRYGLGAYPGQPVARRFRSTPGWVGPLAGLAALAAAMAVVLVLPNSAGAQLRRLLHLPDDRLAPTVALRGHGTYAFETTQRGSSTPVSYNPCAPIHYVVNPDGGPSGAVTLIREAVDEVARRSGFVFRYDGTTDDRTFERRRGPVLVGFATGEEFAELTQNGDAVGVGGSAYVGDGTGFRRYTTGMVALKGSWFREQEARLGRDRERAVVLHELGHVLGLAHVEDRGELMYPTLTRTGFGPGDLDGLARLGATRCG